MTAQSEKLEELRRMTSELSRARSGTGGSNASVMRHHPVVEVPIDRPISQAHICRLSRLFRLNGGET